MNRVWIGALCVLIALLTGCDTGDDGPQPIPPAAQLRIINLVGDSPTLLLDFSSNLIRAIGYAESTRLTPVQQGTHLVVVGHENVLDGTPELFARIDSFPVNRNQEITLVAHGTISDPVLTRVDEVVDTSPGENEAEIKFFNAATGGSSWSVYLSDDPNTTSINGLSAFNLAEAAQSELQTVSAGEKRMFITASAGGDIVYDSGPFSIARGNRLFVAVSDNFGPGAAVRALRVDRNGAQSFSDERMPGALRIANLIAGLGDVDIVINGSDTWTDLTHATLTDYLEFGADERDLDLVVTLAGQPAIELHTVDRTLVSGERTTLVLAADDDGNVESRLVADPTRSMSTGGQIQLIHAAPQAGVADVYIVIPDSNITFSTPNYQLPTLFIEIDTILRIGDYDLIATFAGTKTPIIERTLVELPANSIRTLIIGNPATEGGDFVLINSDDTPAQ